MLDELTEAAIASSGPSNELAPAGSGSKAFLADSSTFVFGA